MNKEAESGVFGTALGFFICLTYSILTLRCRPEITINLRLGSPLDEIVTEFNV